VARDGDGVDRADEPSQDGEEGRGGRRSTGYGGEIPEETYRGGRGNGRWIMLGHPKRQARTRAGDGVS